jgi:hypothetical protein
MDDRPSTRRAVSLKPDSAIRFLFWPWTFSAWLAATKWSGFMPPRAKTDIAAIAKSLIETAAKTLAVSDGYPPTQSVLKQYRVDARAVAAAIVRDLAGGRRGSVTITTEVAGIIHLTELADIIEQLSVGSVTQR